MWLFCGIFLYSVLESEGKMRKILFIIMLFCMTLPVLASDSYVVIFNVNSKIYHNNTCASARRCTKSCIKVPLDVAIENGGRACHNCGG